MKRLIPLILLFGVGTAARAVPVVPNFQQGSMTSHTETESTVTETINSIDYRTGWEYTVTGVGVENDGAALNPGVNSTTVTITPSVGSTGATDGVTGGMTSSFDSLNLQNAGTFTISNPGGSFQFTQSYSGPGMTIQVLQGPYITNTYGNAISCQGPTANFTPYIQYSNSWKDPFERTYNEPQYDNTDFTGRTTTQTVTVKNYPWEDWYDDRTYTNSDGETVRAYEDGADMPIEVEVDGPDGIPDNPGEVIWEKPVRTNMVANNNFNIGLSATLSLPLDKKLQRLCKLAATTQIEQQRQLTANKRLDFEIARLKNCGELMKQGIMFHPKSPYASICADVVVVTPPGKILPHSHDLPQLNLSSPETPSVPSASSSQTPSSPSPSSHIPSQNLSQEVPSSPDTHSSEVQPELESKVSSQVSSGWFRSLFSRRASPPLEEDPPEVLLGGPIQWPPSQLPQ